MAADRDDTRGPGKLMQRARQLGGGTKERSKASPPAVVMPADVLQSGPDGPTVPTRDPNTAPVPRPRTDDEPGARPNVPDPELTEVGRLPPNPVTGRPVGAALDVVPIGPPTVPVPDPPADEATQIRIDPDVTVIHTKDRPADPPKREPLSGKPKLATAEDLGGGADLQEEPLLKWIAIGVGLMVFVAVAFAIIAVLVLSMTQG